MSKFIDLTNQKFGRLTVLERDYSKKRTSWICKCDCGNIKTVSSSNLKQGHTQSCGCLQKERVSNASIKDLKGQKFGRLTVLEKDIIKKSKAGDIYWLCQCECGNIVSINGSNLRSGNTKSCGCLKKERVSEINTKDLKGKVFGKLTVLEKDNTVERKDGRVYWKCRCECGNIKIIRGKELLNGYTKSCGCLVSQGEELVSKILTKCGISYLSQYSFKDLQGDSALLRFDFAIFKEEKLYCLIEYQGKQHYQDIPFFGGEEGFYKQTKYDSLKRKYCEDNNIKLIEIPYWDLDKIDEEYILNLINNKEI